MQSHQFMAKRKGKSGGGDRFYFIGLSTDGDCTHETKTLAPWRESYDKPGQCIKKQRRHFANKGLHNQSYDFSNSHIWMWKLVHKEGRAPKNSFFQIVVLDKTPLDCKEIKPVNIKGNQPWIYTGRTDAEVEAPIFGYLMWRANSLEKTLMLGKIKGKRRCRQPEDEMVR